MPRKDNSSAAILAHALRDRTVPAAHELSERIEGERVRCLACGLRCRITRGKNGICEVRFNRDGTLYAPRGYVAGLQADPIEKKPFFHAFPGSHALSFGMLGCNLHCPFCQNWLSSQALREDSPIPVPGEIGAEKIIDIAAREGTPVVVSTYNEPLITAEWSVELFSLAKARGMTCGYVSNGCATPEVLEYLRPHLDLFKVDLKGFRQETYRKLGGTLEAVVDSIRLMHELEYWVEVVTLLVPGLNDSGEELEDLAGFLVSVSPDIPWHVTAFHPDFRMTDTRRTEVEDLERAVKIGRSAGLRYVYAGNLPGRMTDLENTRCPGCNELLIERRGFTVIANRFRDEGECPSCGAGIAGFWSRERHVHAAPTTSGLQGDHLSPMD